MKIKKLVIALAAIIGLSGFISTSAEAAQTYFPPVSSPCKVKIESGTPTWPMNGHFFQCIGTATNGTVRNTATNVNPILKQKLDAAGVDVFVFENAAGVNGYIDFQAHVIPFTGIQVDDFGVTWPEQNPYHPKPLIVVMTKNIAGTAYTPTELAKATAHETGHAMDIILGYPSQGTTFQNMLAVDFTDFDQITNVSWAGLPSGCTSKPKNSAKLLCWEQNNATTPQALQKEFFADLYASYQPGTGTLPSQVGVKMGTYFTLNSGQPQVAKLRTRQFVINLATQP